MPFSFSMEVIPWSTSSLALTGPMPATRMRSLMATLAGYVHGELLRAVPVLIDADGVVVAGVEPLPNLLPWLDRAREDVVPRQGRRTRKCCHLDLRYEKWNYTWAIEMRSRFNP